MPEVIDAFGHVVPESVLDQLLDARGDGGTKRMTSAAVAYLRNLSDQDMTRQVEDLDAHGIDKQVITVSPTNIWLDADPADMLPVVRAANDDIRSRADQYPDRFIPVATLPYLEGPYLEELERCVEDLDLRGVQIFTHSGGRPLDDQTIDPFFELVDSLDVPIWMHPTNYAWDGWENINDHGLYLVLGWPFETTIAMTRLAVGGVLDRYPELDIICHHMGGATSHLAHRISMLYYQVAKADREHSDALAADLRETLGSFYADTARGGSTTVLEYGQSFFDDGHLVFGTDYPFGPQAGRYVLENERRAVEEMDVSDAGKEAVLSGNIRTVIDS